MNIKNITLFLSVISCVEIYPVEDGQNQVEKAQIVQAITREKVTKESGRIAALIQMHRRAMYVIGAAAVVGVGLTWYQLYKMFNPTIIEQDIKDAIEKGENKALEKVAIYLKDTKGINKKDFLKKANVHYNNVIEKKIFEEHEIYNVKPLYKKAGIILQDSGKFVWNTCKGIGSAIFSLNTLKMCGQIAAVGTAQHFVGRIRRYFAHQDSLRWYIAYDASYKENCERIIALTQNVTEITIDEIYVFAIIANNLVQSFTRICGFMEYRITHIEKTRQLAAQKIENYLFNLINNWAKTVSDLLVQKNYTEIAQVTIQLQAQVERKIQNFILIDSDEDIAKEILLTLNDMWVS